MPGSPRQSMQNAWTYLGTSVWGYKRYWMAEHHDIKGMASTAISLSIGFITECSSTIKVEWKEIMLQNHISLVIAGQFGKLCPYLTLWTCLGQLPCTGHDDCHGFQAQFASSNVEGFVYDIKVLICYSSLTKPVNRIRQIQARVWKLLYGFWE